MRRTPTICGYMELQLADELGHDLAPDCCDDEKAGKVRKTKKAAA